MQPIKYPHMELLTDAEVKYLDDARKQAEWLNPITTIELANAVLDGKREVRLKGKVFTIKYEGSKVFVRPAKGLIPCGWFEKERLKLYLELVKVVDE